MVKSNLKSNFKPHYIKKKVKALNIYTHRTTNAYGERKMTNKLYSISTIHTHTHTHMSVCVCACLCTDISIYREKGTDFKV